MEIEGEIGDLGVEDLKKLGRLEAQNVQVLSKFISVDFTLNLVF